MICILQSSYHSSSETSGKLDTGHTIKPVKFKSTDLFEILCLRLAACPVRIFAMMNNSRNSYCQKSCSMMVSL